MSTAEKADKTKVCRVKKPPSLQQELDDEELQDDARLAANTLHKSEAADPPPLKPKAVLALQRTVGNKAARRFLPRHQASVRVRHRAPGSFVQLNPRFRAMLEEPMPRGTSREARLRIQDRRRRMREFCRSLSPAEAQRLHSRLTSPGDDLGALFRYQLHRVVQREMLRILEERGQQEPPPAPGVRIPLGRVEILRGELTDEQILERIRAGDPEWTRARDQAEAELALQGVLENVLFPLPSFGRVPLDTRRVLRRTRQIYRANQLARRSSRR